VHVVHWQPPDGVEQREEKREGGVLDSIHLSAQSGESEEGCEGSNSEGENYGFASLESFLGVFHSSLVAPLLVGFTPVNVG